MNVWSFFHIIQFGLKNEILLQNKFLFELQTALIYWYIISDQKATLRSRIVDSNWLNDYLGYVTSGNGHPIEQNEYPEWG